MDKDKELSSQTDGAEWLQPPPSVLEIARKAGKVRGAAELVETHQLGSRLLIAEQPVENRERPVAGRTVGAPSGLAEQSGATDQTVTLARGLAPFTPGLTGSTQAVGRGLAAGRGDAGRRMPWESAKTRP